MKKTNVRMLVSALMLLLLAVFVIPVTDMRAAQEEDQTEVYYGDVDDSGKVDAKDVTSLRRYLAGGWNVTINENKADINQDGAINAKDVTMLRRFLAGGWGVELPSKPVKNTIEISTPNGTEILTEAEGYWNLTKFSTYPEEVSYTIPYVNSDGKVKKEIEINCKGEKKETTFDDNGKVLLEDGYYKRYDGTIYDVLTYKLEQKCSYEYFADGKVSKSSSDDERYLKQDAEYDESGRLIYLKNYYYSTGYESITKKVYNDNDILIKDESYSFFSDQDNSYGYKETSWIKEYGDDGLLIREQYLTKDFDDNKNETIIEYEYNDAEMVAVYSENGEKTEEKYYLKDNLKKDIKYNSDGSTETWEAVLDEKGRIAESKENENPCEFQYDENDRVVKKTIHYKEYFVIYSFAYDSEDRIVTDTIIDYRDNGDTIYSSLTTEYTYDTEGEIIKTIENSYSSYWKETTITTKEYEDGEVVRRAVETKSGYGHRIEETEYVSTGRIEKTTDLNNNTITIHEYDKEGNKIGTDGIKNVYDERGRIIKLVAEKYSYSEDKYIARELPVEYTEEGSKHKMEIQDYQDDYYGGTFYSFDAGTRTIQMYWETSVGHSYYCTYDGDWNLIKESKIDQGDYGNVVVLWYKDGKAEKFEINSNFNQENNFYTYSTEEKQPGTEMIMSLKGGVYVFDEDNRLISKLVEYWEDNIITDFYGSDGKRIKRLYNYHGKDGESCVVYFDDGNEKKAIFTDKNGKSREFEYVYDEDGRLIVKPMPGEYALSDIFVVEEGEYDSNGKYTKTKTTKIDNNFGLVEEKYYIKGSSYIVDKVVCTDSNGITREYKCSYNSDGNVIVGVGDYDTNWYGEDGKEGDIVYHIYEKEYNENGNCIKYTDKDINHRTGDVLVSRIDEYEYDGEGDIIKHTYITRNGEVHES